ncbi:MAG: GNAT family N-acetyltransferase [Gammaproteobacteria bacterium]|nr:GNAT family N-acetyltransferase [Gammaproteobacteria bacterium]
MITFRKANEKDLAFLIQMLSDDQLGSQRENYALPLDECYEQAFQVINSDPNNDLVVVEYENQIAGMLQITFIPYLTYMGSWRCLIEGVRIHKDFRGRGLGTRLMEWAIDRAKSRKCAMLQLTSNKQRSSAIKFYKQFGFEASHEGFKLYLSDNTRV